MPQIDKAVNSDIIKKITFMMTSTVKTCPYYNISVSKIYKKKKPKHKNML
jgi:hypothetical protein